MNDISELIDKIENNCYSGKYTEALDEVNAFIEVIPNYTIEKPLIYHILKNMMIAMENEDYIMVGDCLEYGIKPLLDGRRESTVFIDENLNVIPDVQEEIFYYATYSDEPTLCIKNIDGYIIRLNSLFSPSNEVEKWIDNINLNPKTPVVCIFGIGTGLFAEALLKRIPENSKLVIYEPDKKVLNYCLESGKKLNCDTAEKRITERLEKIIHDDRVCLIVEEEDKLSFRYKLEEILNYLELQCLTVAKHNSYEKIYSKSYLRFLREINDHRIKMLTNKNTMAFFKEHFVEDLLKNMWAYKRMNICFEIEAILPADIPVIIVSAGPSLENNVELLRQVKGHCLIFAVDTAIRYLLKHDILPDLMITIDSIKPVEYFSDERTWDIPCIFDVTANPKIFKIHKGRKFLFNCSNFYVSALFNTIEKPFFMAVNGGSVATAAFSLLYMFRQKKIIMIGQDLASKNGVTHAGGVNDGSKNKETTVEGYYGDQVTTRSDWLGYLKWFEKAIEKIKEENSLSDSSIRVINATEGGAKIHGAEQMSLQEAIDDCKDIEGKLPDYDFKKEVEKLDYYLDEEEYNKLMFNHNKSIEKLKEIKIKADEAVRICNNLINGIEKGTVSGSFVDKEKKKITKIIEWCSKTTIFPLLNNYLITDVIDDICQLRFSKGDIKTTEKNGIELMKISFEAIIDATQIIYQKAKEILSD